MPRQAQAQRRTVFECTAPFSIWVNGIPDMYAAGRKVDEDDPILRTHGHAFVPVTATTIEQATAAPGERRAVRIPEEMQGKTYRLPPEADPVVLNPTALEPTDHQTKEADHG